MSTPVLTVENVTKRFGGLSALDGASMTFQAGKLHAVIGPNGAGKTTLFNVITGTLAPTSGRIRFLGTDITGWPVHRISRMGLARTLQIKSVFSGMTVRENLWIAAQSRDGVFKPFASARHCRRSNEKVDALCEELGLTPLAEQQAANLSYGDVALLEIGLALATEPKLLLLDEPICGMGPAETEKTVAKIQQISERIATIVIEHDIEVVFNIADEIVVMTQGAVLACGTPAQIAANHDVRTAYLGDDDDA
jgi:branched-chain amino acid transport system ATP-binding protein